MKPAAPEEAVGIMASSQPLVDMVAQSAGNPQGGMSPLNFNQGGTVFLRQANQVPTESSILNFNMKDLNRRLTPNIQVPELKEARPTFEFPEEGSRFMRFLKGRINLGPQTSRILGTKINFPVKSPLKGIGQFFFSDESPGQKFTVSKDFPTASSSQLATLDALVQMNPNNKDEIYSLGKKIITDDKSDATGENLANLMKSEKLMLDKKADDELDRIQKEANEKARKEAEGKAPEIDPITTDKQKKDSEELIEKEKPKTSIVKKSEDVETIDNVENITDSKEGEEPTQDPVKQGEDPKNAMDETIQNINKNAEEGNQEATTKSIEDYAEEFKKAMPKFEGMTEEEKGFAFMEAGLAIMGGQSPRALENIAEGLKPLTKRFAKNKEQERAFNQQINIAAAKYGISKVDQDRQRELALSDQLAKEGRTYAPGRVVLKPFTYKGKKYGKNDFFEFTRGEMDTDEFKNIPAGSLASESAFGQIEQSKRQFSINQANIEKAYAELKEKQLGEGIKYSNYDDNMQEYQSAGQDFYRGLRMRAQLGEAAKLLEISLIDGKKEGGLADELLGAKGYFGDKFNKAMNLLDVDRDRLTSLRSTRPAQFNAIMKNIGTQMLVEILNESTKTVSDNDRKRVEELTATLTDFSAFAKDPEVIRRQLLNLDASIKAGVVKNSTTMSRLESTFDKGLKVSGVPLSTLDPKKELLKINEGLTTGLTGVKDTSGEVIKVSDIWDPTADDGAGNFKQLDLNI
jgi:hypothetical protein